RRPAATVLRPQGRSRPVREPGDRSGLCRPHGRICGQDAELAAGLRRSHADRLPRHAAGAGGARSLGFIACGLCYLERSEGSHGTGHRVALAMRSLHVAVGAPEWALAREEDPTPPAPTVRSPLRSTAAGSTDAVAKPGA